MPLAQQHVTDYMPQFKDQNDAEAAQEALNGGLLLTLQRFPFLAGTLSLADRESNRLALNYPINITDGVVKEVFRSKQIPFDEHTFPYTYEQLRREGMPPSALHASYFVPDDFANYAGIPEFGEGMVDFHRSDAPAMRLQACFIPGGLVLSTYIHHTVMDCSGVTTFWTAFSTNVSKLAGTRELDDDEITGTASFNSLPQRANVSRTHQCCRSTVYYASSTRTNRQCHASG